MFASRVLPFSEAAALIQATLMADTKKQGRPASALDMIIAAMAETNGCKLATDNETDFDGVDVINPLRGDRQ